MTTPTPTIRVNFGRKQAYEDLAISYAPVSYWRFGETSGTAAYDRVGGNHGTYTGGYTLDSASLLVDDTTNPAVAFNGSSGYVTVPDADSLDVDDAFSFFALIDRAAAGAKHYIAQKGTAAWGIYVSAANALTLEKVGTADIVASSVTLDANPHSICVTKSGSASRLYVDGIDVTGTVTNQTLINSSSALVIGRSAVPGDYFSGTIDEPILWDSAITPAQVAALHNAYAVGELGAAIDSVVAADFTNVMRGQYASGSNGSRSGEAIGRMSLTLRNDNHFWTAERNLVGNASFEWGLSDWTTAAVSGVTSAATTLNWVADAPTGAGAHCAQATLPAVSGAGVSTTIEGFFPSGTTVTCEVYLRSVSGTTGVEVALGISGDVDASASTITSSWAPYTVTWTAAADTLNPTLAVRSTTASAAVVKFDRVQVNRGATANTYIEAPTWPMLQPGATIHAAVDYSGDIPIFTGRIHDINLRLRELAVDIECEDAGAELGVEVDHFISSISHYRARYGLIDAAIQAIEGNDQNLLLGQTTSTGWAFDGGSSGGTTITVNDVAQYNSGGTALTVSGSPQLLAGRHYLLSFDARELAGADVLTVQWGTFGDPVTIVTGTTAAALTSSYQRFHIPYLSATSDPPFISFGTAGTGAEIQKVVISTGLREVSSTATFGAPTGTRRHNWLLQTLPPEPTLFQAWSPGFFNPISNPEAQTNTTGWVVTTNAFVTNAGATISRAAAGTYYGDSVGTTHPRAFTLISDTDPLEGAHTSPSGTFYSGKSYRLMVSVHGTGGSGMWTIGIGSNGTPADVSTISVNAATSAQWPIDWTPSANRTDVRVFLRSSAGGQQITFTGLYLYPSWGLRSPITYLRTGFTLNGPATITSVADGVYHATSTSVTTRATTGSGVFLETYLPHIDGVVYTLSVWLKASTGTPSVVVGLGDPYGQDSSPESATTTVTLSTTWQRVVLHFTGSDSAVRQLLIAWVAVSSGSVITFYIDAPTVTIGTAVQDYLPPHVGGLDPADLDIAPLRDALVAATAELAELSVSQARYWIDPLTVRPWWQLATRARQSLPAQAIAATFDVGELLDITGLQKSADSVYQVALVETASTGYPPGTGLFTSATYEAKTFARATDTQVRRAGTVRVIEVDGIDHIQPPVGTDTTAQEIADLVISRNGVARSRPQWRVVGADADRMAAILTIKPDDRVRLNSTAGLISQLDVTVLRRTVTFTPGIDGPYWELAVDSEEWVPE